MNINKWINELRKIAILAPLANEDVEKNLTKTWKKAYFCKNRFISAWESGLTPQEAFDEEMQLWIDNA